MATSKITAIYARQSVDKEKSESIETQIELCKKREESDNVKEYIDKGLSGKDTDRPALQRLIEEIQLGTVGKVVVYKLDRISRNVQDFYELYNLMNAHGCAFVSVSESFDTSSSMGRAMMGILAVFAQMERENIQLRVKDNIAHRIREGGWGSGRAPFGYVNVKEGKLATIKPDPNYVEIIKHLFQMYAEDTSVSLRYIYTDYILKNKIAGINGANSVGRILANPVYCVADKNLYNYFKSCGVKFLNDESEWNGTRCACVQRRKRKAIKSAHLNGDLDAYLLNSKGVIDSRTFITVQKRLVQNKSYTTDRTPKSMKELSSIVKCEKCGLAVLNVSGYLYCTGKHRGKNCDAMFRGVHLPDVQEKVGDEVQRYFDNINTYRKKKQRNLKNNQNKILKKQEEIQNLIEVAKAGGAAAKIVSEEIEKLQNEISAIELKINLGVNETDLIQFRLSKYIDIMTEKIVYKKLPDEVKASILKILVNRIVLHEDGSITMDWKEDLNIEV